MFSFTGLSPKQCDVMTNKHAVFMTKDGRISLAGGSDHKLLTAELAEVSGVTHTQASTPAKWTIWQTP